MIFSARVTKYLEILINLFAFSLMFDDKKKA